ncbi:MAG TPA: hypothetical protein VIT91_14635 [Chthoniobacterales bacterium]
MFSVLVPNPGEYDPDSVQILEKPKVELNGDSHCERRIPWSGTFDSWDQHTVRYTLNAPSIGDHNDTIRERIGIRHPSFHTGGGSRATILITPTFAARRKGASRTIPAPESTVEMAANDVRTINLQLGKTWRVDVLARSGQSWKQSLSIDPQKTSDSKVSWSVAYHDGVLTLQTRSQPRGEGIR